MGKYKPAGRAKGKTTTAANTKLGNTRRALPCLIVVVSAIALFALMFYGMLRTAKQ